MKNRLAAKVLISAAAIFVMIFALGYTLPRRRAAPTPADWSAPPLVPRQIPFRCM
jgi:hypothetical protein